MLKKILVGMKEAIQKDLFRKSLVLAFIVLLLGAISITGNSLKNDTNSEIMINYYKSI